jgi:hypothetical protein
MRVQIEGVSNWRSGSHRATAETSLVVIATFERIYRKYGMERAHVGPM